MKLRIIIKTTSMVDTRMSLTVVCSPIFKKFIFVNIVSLCFKGLMQGSVIVSFIVTVEAII